MKYSVNNLKGKEEFEDLFKTYYNDLLFYAKRFVCDKDIAEDIVQDTFLNIWKNRKKIHPGGNIKAYLFKSVYNNCLNFLKHKSVRQNFQESEKAASHANEQDLHKLLKYRRKSLLQKEAEEQLKKAIDKLPEKRRRIFILSRKFGMKNREIAEYTQVSIKLVERQLSLAVSAIRAELDSFLKDKSN